MELKLRNYQEEAIENIYKYYKEGVHRQVVVMATGLGKTVVFAHLISQLKKETGKKALVIAHREELLTQAQDKFYKVDPSLHTEIEQATNHADPNADVIIASVPTIGRTNSTRIQKFNPTDFSIIVVDETHHASAKTYKEVFRNFGILKNEADWNKDLLLLGVTATPSRNDNQGIDQIYDKVTYNYGIIKAIEDGWLARIKAYRINTATDLTGVRTTAGDFAVGELAERVNNDDRNGLVVATYKNLLENKKALCFAVDVKHAQSLTQLFQSEGISTGIVTGTTPKTERAKLLQRYKKGDIKVMVNCMVLTEGFDEPSIEAILMARPTQSGILFNQMIGRGTRLDESIGKNELTVVDFNDNTYRHTLKTIASLLGIEKAIDFKGQDILLNKEKIDRLAELAPDYDFEDLDIDKIDYAIEEVDLLSGLQIPSEVSTYTNYEWHRYLKDTYRINLGNNQWLEIGYDIAGEYSVSEHKFDKDTHKTTSKILGNKPTLQDAIESSDKYIRRSYEDRLKLISTNAGWRKTNPSDAQLDLLKKFGVTEAVLKTIDRGSASRLITKLINKNQQNKKFQRRYNPYSRTWYTRKIGN